MKFKKLQFASLLSIGLIACGGEKADQSKIEVEKSSINTSFMDTTISSSDDFFSYANGNWVKDNPVPSNEARWGSFNELDKQNKTKIKSIVTDAENAKADKGSVKQLVGDFYNSYMDSVKRNEAGYAPIKPLLDQINSLSSKQELANLFVDFEWNGISTPFSFYIYLDKKNSKKNVPYLSQSGLGLPNKDYYSPAKADIQEAYRKFISDLFQLVGTEETKANKNAAVIYAFEEVLAEASNSPVENRNPEATYNPTSVEELNALAPAFAWEEYFNGVGIENIDKIIVSQPKFIGALSNLIEKTSLEDLKTYLSYNVLNSNTGRLSDEFEALNFAFYSTTLRGVSEMKPRDERAINTMTRNAISEALGHLFVDEYFSESDKERVNEMLDNIKLAFKDRLDQLTWMSNETKEKALLKLNSFGRKLGFPDKWKDYSNLNLDRTLYYNNVIACNMFSVKENLSKYGKEVDPTEWGMPPHMVNAYYSPLRNEIVFPAGIMQAPFFDSEAEDAVNYGGIGMVIGHEFTHGFDDQGAKYDHEGNMENWWTESDIEEFRNRTLKLEETFNNFCPFDSICVQGDLTLGENIADLGGLTFAYYAYMKTDEAKSGKLVNGFTPEQRFFIAYGQLWKINYKDEALKNLIATDPHSPGMYRINGPLMNMPEFFEAFDVREGSKMRKSEEEIAKIW